MALFGRLVKLIPNAKGGKAILDPAAEQPVFYSALEDFLINHPTQKAPGKQWLSTIKGATGIKGQEVEWSGIEKFLNERLDKPVTRQEIDDYMRDHGTRQFRPAELSMSERGDSGQSYEDWLDEHEHRIERAQRDLVADDANDNIDDWAPYVDITEETVPGLRDPAQINSDIRSVLYPARHYLDIAEQARNQRYDLFGFPQNYIEGQYSPEHYVTDALQAERRRAVRLRELEQELERANYLRQRDPETPDLFTGQLDEDLLPEVQPEREVYRARVLDPNGNELHVDDELYDSRREAERATEDLHHDFYPDAERDWIDQQIEYGNYRDEAINAVQEDYPWEEEGQGVLYAGHKLDGGDNYDELLLNLPEFEGAHGYSPSTHWDEVDEANNNIGHIRYQDRRGVPSSQEQRIWDAAKREYDSVTEEMNKRIAYVRGYNPYMSQDEVIARDPELVAMFKRRRELANGPLSVRRERLADNTTPRERVLAIDEIQSDWHQKGRERGYKRDTPPTDAERAAFDEFVLDRQITQDRLRRQIAKLNRERNELDYDSGGQYGPAQKMASRERDAVVEQLRKHVDGIEEEIDQRRREVFGGDIKNIPFANNIWAEIAMKRALRKAADEGYDRVAWSGKIKNGDWDERGQEGAEFYDKVLVNIANKLGRKAGVQVEPFDLGPYSGWNSIKMTPEFKEFLKKGLPLFMWPLFAAGAAGGLLSRRRSAKEA